MIEQFKVQMNYISISTTFTESFDTGTISAVISLSATVVIKDLRLPTLHQSVHKYSNTFEHMYIHNMTATKQIIASFKKHLPRARLAPNISRRKIILLY